MEGIYKQRTGKTGYKSTRVRCVNEDRTVTFNLDATGEYKDAEDVRLMGTVAGTNWDNGLSMEKAEINSQ
ncbi:MAG: hypothetical protein ACLTDV_08440 [Eubacterium sp.]